MINTSNEILQETKRLEDFEKLRSDYNDDLEELRAKYAIRFNKLLSDIKESRRRIHVSSKN